MRSSSTAIRLLSLLLFLVLVSIVAYWTMLLLAPRGAIAPTDSLGDNNRPPLPVAARLFGARNTEAQAEAAPPPVNVKVFGILDAGARGVAILGIDDRPPKAYAVRQRIEGGSTLKAVMRDKVVIDHHGQRIEAQAPNRYSLDILTSNAGRSSLPQGIEEADEAASHDAFGDEGVDEGGAQQPAPGAPDASSGTPAQVPQHMPAPGGMPMDPATAEVPGQVPDTGLDPHVLDGLSPAERAAAQHALEEGLMPDVPAGDGSIPGAETAPPGGDTGMSFERPYFEDGAEEPMPELMDQP